MSADNDYHCRHFLFSGCACEKKWSKSTRFAGGGDWAIFYWSICGNVLKISKKPHNIFVILRLIDVYTNHTNR